MYHFRQVFQNFPRGGGRRGDLFDKPFKNFLPVFWGRLQNMSAEDDENFDKSEPI